MNFLLKLNKKYILISFLIILIFVFLNIINKFMVNKKYEFTEKNLEEIKADIIKPKFSINGNDQQILITANQGNFLSTNKIMLEQNVKFKSKRFELKSNKVLFDKLNFTAHSEEKAEFFAKKTAITSKGFDITQNGEKINFNGKTKLIIK
ncbi:MAG: hypothetical protein CMI96_04455 [Pelagibacteraceae bacterium]|nr:hypothetical protein [Pelagibacteraceae bacterium]